MESTVHQQVHKQNVVESDIKTIFNSITVYQRERKIGLRIIIPVFDEESTPLSSLSRGGCWLYTLHKQQ